MRNVVKKEFKKLDQYGSLFGSSSTVATASVVKLGGSAMFCDGSWGCKIVEKDRILI